MKNSINLTASNNSNQTAFSFQFLIFLFIALTFFTSCQKEGMEDLTTENTATITTTEDALNPGDATESTKIEKTRTQTANSRSSRDLVYSKTMEVGYDEWNKLYFYKEDLPDPYRKKIEVEVTAYWGTPNLYIHGYDKYSNNPWRTIRKDASDLGMSTGGTFRTTTFRATDLLQRENKIFINIYGKTAAEYKIKIYVTDVDCEEYPTAEQIVTREYNPVCGCNGMEYDNPSSAMVVGITSWTMGPCEGGTGPILPPGGDMDEEENDPDFNCGFNAHFEQGRHTYYHGDDVYINFKVTSGKHNIDNVKLYIDGEFIRKENHFPYEWGRPHTNNDHQLNRMRHGHYEIVAKVKTKCGFTKEFKYDLEVR